MVALVALLLGSCGSSEPSTLVANDDTASVAPGAEVVIDLLGNDENTEGGELWLGGLLEDGWAPGVVVDQDRRAGIVTYQAPEEPDTYVFEYRLYDYDPAASVEDPNPSTTAKVTIVVE